MQVVERSALVSYSAAQMYALVNDVDRYPEFLPWCTGAEVHERSPQTQLATVRVARGVLKTKFTTRNTLTPDTEIRMQGVEGPFKDLQGLWRFTQLGERGSKVSFHVDFEFRNRLTAGAFGAVFESLCGNIVEAFTARARAIYG